MPDSTGGVAVVRGAKTAPEPDPFLGMTFEAWDSMMRANGSAAAFWAAAQVIA